MPVFYLLHNLFHHNTDYGKRNSKIFIFGVLIYIILFFLLKYAQIEYPSTDVYYNNLQYSLLILLMADIAVMGWTYKRFFGRNILNELGEEDNFMYDEKRHKYSKKNIIKQEKRSTLKSEANHDIKSLRSETTSKIKSSASETTSDIKSSKSLNKLFTKSSEKSSNKLFTKSSNKSSEKLSNKSSEKSSKKPTQNNNDAPSN